MAAALEDGYLGERTSHPLKPKSNPMMRSLLLVCIVVTQTTSGAEPPGWPQWRGPTFDCISTETGLADSWPEAGPPVLWNREIGQGYSSFIAVGPHVFTLTQTLYEQMVVCLDA